MNLSIKRPATAAATRPQQRHLRKSSNRQNSPVLVPLTVVMNESFQIDAGGDFKMLRSDPKISDLKQIMKGQISPFKFPKSRSMKRNKSGN